MVENYIMSFLRREMSEDRLFTDDKLVEVKYLRFCIVSL